MRREASPVDVWYHKFQHFKSRKRGVLVNRTWFFIIVTWVVFPHLLAQEEKEKAFSSQDVVHAAALLGLTMTTEERKLMMEDLLEALSAYETNRSIQVENSVPPALGFRPYPSSFQIPNTGAIPSWPNPGKITRPENLDDAAFFSVAQLSVLIRTRQVTSLELTKMYLKRLKKFGPKLECVVTLTEDLALDRAKKADAEMAAGKYRGPLHGIPYGAKDLFSVKGYPTTWGAVPYKNQVLDQTATVIEKLDTAGAVLVAKLTLGALAWGDVWFGGTTKNPWNLEQGSSGSSAGSASATSAGLVGFSLGTETWGSIVSPCTRCGVTGLRPTFGRVSRGGAMALSWSMDKVGPICRTVGDCALVFDTIRGADARDPSTVDADFGFTERTSLDGMKIGYLKSAFEAQYDGRELDIATLKSLEKLGATLVPLELPELDVTALAFILSAEAAAAFDTLTRTDQDDLLVRQIKNAWPNVFRAARFIPAVEYIQANRIRTLLIEAMDKILTPVDLYVAPSFGGDNLLLTNLTGHPCVVLPNGFLKENKPKSISFIGKLMDDATILAVAQAYQDAANFHTPHPPGF